VDVSNDPCYFARFVIGFGDGDIRVRVRKACRLVLAGFLFFFQMLGTKGFGQGYQIRA